MANTMCGSEAIAMTTASTSSCKKFVYLLNHASEHCAPNNADNVTMDNYKNCFYTELSVHLPGRDSCSASCSDGSDPHNLGGPCIMNCLHVHQCLDECNSDKYPYRSGIEHCLHDCAGLSPALEEPTCRSTCGSHSPNRKCWCDPTCHYTGDCCPDYESMCNGGLQMHHSDAMPLPNETVKPPPMNVTVAKGNPFKSKREHVDPTEIGIDIKLNNATSTDDTATADPKVAEAQATAAEDAYTTQAEAQHPVESSVEGDGTIDGAGQAVFTGDVLGLDKESLLASKGKTGKTRFLLASTRGLQSGGKKLR